MAETITPEVSEFVQEYLENIPGEKPAGTDAANDEEYFKLNMEIPKTAPDYRKCIELSDIILKERSKDLKVATWLCFALFRTEKIKGLKDGLDIIYHLLMKYGNELYPENELHRSKALQFLNTARFYKLVEKEKITGSNANDIIESGEILNKITEESKKLFPDNIPILKSLKETIETHVGNAKKITSPPKKETVSAGKQEGAEGFKTGAGMQAGAQTPRPQTVSAAKEVLGSEKDAIKQLRQTLLYFFEREADGEKKEVVPESPVVFGLSRYLQWGNLIRPVDNSKITQIDAPNQIIQNKFQEWFSSSSWDTLIPRIEISFLKPDSEFPYWLDLQRYAVRALEQKGGNYGEAAKEVKFRLAILLKKIPDLPQLIFKDKQTPFANNETKKWIDDEVKPVLSGEGSGSTLLPPVMDEEYETINEEYKAALNGLPENFEETVDKMQQGIKSDERRKGKFLRRLNLANFYFAAKQYNLAKINLQELSKLIAEYNLAEWEPALCTSVWQSLYTTNTRIDDGKKESKLEIEKEQDELFSKIAKYDGVTAIKLINKLKS